jgi:hypothetical protein
MIKQSLSSEDKIGIGIEMTDRELLELAAKAIDKQWLSYSANKGLCCRGYGIEYYWNPLTDSGDALDLAITLDIAPIQDKENQICSACLSDVNCVRVPYKGNEYAATRRAIVKAAAKTVKVIK